MLDYRLPTESEIRDADNSDLQLFYEELLEVLSLTEDSVAYEDLIPWEDEDL